MDYSEASLTIYPLSLLNQAAKMKPKRLSENSRRPNLHHFPWLNILFSGPSYPLGKVSLTMPFKL